MGKALRFGLTATWCAASLCAQQPSAEISYFHEIRPIIQRSCQGCHQPAMKYGGLDITRYESFAAGGNKGSMPPPARPRFPCSPAMLRYCLRA